MNKCKKMKNTKFSSFAKKKNMFIHNVLYNFTILILLSHMKKLISDTVR